MRVHLLCTTTSLPFPFPLLLLLSAPRFWCDQNSDLVLACACKAALHSLETCKKQKEKKFVVYVVWFFSRSFMA